MNAGPFESLQLATPESLRGRGSLKWTRFAPAIGAWVAESDLGTSPSVRRALRSAIDNDLLGYTPVGTVTALAESTAEFARQRYRWSIDPSRIGALPDAVKGLEVGMATFVDDGSPVIVPTPAYTPFLKVPLSYGREVIEVPSTANADGWQMDLDGIARAFEQGGRLLVLCNPHNPTGRAFSRDELSALSRIVEEFEGVVFADELHAPLTYSGTAHTPYATVSDEAAQHSFTVMSASKAWNIAGLKCAQIVLTSDRLSALWDPKAYIVSHGASTLGMIANIAAYSGGMAWLDEEIAYLEANRDEFLASLRDLLPEVSVVTPDATYLAWIDCSALGMAGLTSDFLLDRAGVATVDGSTCGTGYDSFIRFNFALPRPLIRRSVELIASAVSSRQKVGS